MFKSNKNNTNYLAYLAGFLDADGSIYVRVKKRFDYKYGYQISPYIVFFQSLEYKEEFSYIFNNLNIGYLRERNDNMLEYVINKHSHIKSFLELLLPFLVLKKKQAYIMLEIIQKKLKINNKDDFEDILLLCKNMKDLNYSNYKHKLTP